MSGSFSSTVEIFEPRCAREWRESAPAGLPAAFESFEAGREADHCGLAPVQEPARFPQASRGSASPAVSIVVPTYNEAASMPELIRRIHRSVENCEIIVVDDGSHDGTAEIAEALGARVVRRKGKLGLASAVLAGFECSTGPIVGVLDGDLSHPPEVIPNLVGIAASGHIAIASRYVPGGSARDWPLRRRVMSRTGARLARLLLEVRARDCMSGFFFAPREAFARTRLRTRGFKLLLNVLVDNHGVEAVEIPYAFTERIHGISKLGWGEILNYWKTVRALRD